MHIKNKRYILLKIRKKDNILILMKDNYKQIFSREQIMTTLKNNLRRNTNSKDKNKTKNYSPYGQKLREAKKISLFYGGLSKKYLQKINHKNLNLPSKLSENQFIILESRLDVVLFRSGFFDSIKSAKQMVRIGAIKVNNKIVISPGFFVTPGDILSVFGKNNKKKSFYTIEKNKLLQQKNLFFVNRRSLKKTGQNKENNLKEKIDFSKTLVKIKNQILTRKAIDSRYKGSLMLLSVISFAFAYSQKLRVYNNKKADITTTTSANYTKGKKEKLYSNALDEILLTTQGEAKNTKIGSKAKSLSLTTSTYFNKSKSNILSEKNYPLKIEKDNGYGLCLFFINTMKNLINLKDSKRLRKNYHHQTQKLAPFFTRLMAFNNEIKINNRFTYISRSLAREGLSNNTYLAKNPISGSVIAKGDSSVFTKREEEVLKKQVDTLFLFFNYLLNLKKRYSSFLKKKTLYKKQQHTLFFKNQNLFEMKKTKAQHLEISYKSLSIVFLFPPQRVNFPFFLNPSLIYK